MALGTVAIFWNRCWKRSWRQREKEKAGELIMGFRIEIFVNERRLQLVYLQDCRTRQHGHSSRASSFQWCVDFTSRLSSAHCSSSLETRVSSRQLNCGVWSWGSRHLGSLCCSCLEVQDYCHCRSGRCQAVISQIFGRHTLSQWQRSRWVPVSSSIFAP